MLKLKSLSLRNFRSWKKLDLTEEMLQGLVLFNGDNGNGKSSIRHAIEYLFFDTTMDSLKLSEITFNKGGNCFIRGVFEVNENLIEIEKYREHDKYNNSTILRVNDNSDSFTFTDRRETQKKILEVLDIDLFETTSSSIFSKRSLSFPEATESKRKDVLYRIIDFSVYKKAYDESTEIIKKLERGINTKDSEVAIVNALIGSIEEDLQEIEDSKVEAKQVTNSIVKESKERIKTLKDKPVKRIENKLLKLGEQFNFLQDKKKSNPELQNNIDKLQLESNRYTKDIKILVDRITKRITMLNNSKFVLKTKEDNLQKLKESQCPILSIPCDALLEHSTDKIKELEDEVGGGEVALDAATTELQEIEEQKQFVTNQKKEILQKIEEINTKIEEEEKEDEEESSRLYSEMYDVGVTLKEIEDYNHTTELERVRLRNRIEAHLSKYSDLVDSIRIKKEKLSKIVGKKKELEEELKGLVYNKAVAAISAEGFSHKGIPNMKVDTFLGAIEVETNKVLSSLSDRLSVDIESQSVLESKEVREKVSYKVRHPLKKIEDLHSYSSGQQHRVKVADMFAMNALINKFDFMILDEVLGLSLDERGKEATIELLKLKAKEIGFIAVIDHSQQLKGSFDTVYDITMNNGVSGISI